MDAELTPHQRAVLRMPVEQLADEDFRGWDLDTLEETGPLGSWKIRPKGWSLPLPESIKP
jgi:hypothetical protein